MASALIFTMFVGLSVGLKFPDKDAFLRIKCRPSHLMRTPSPECRAFLNMSTTTHGIHSTSIHNNVHSPARTPLPTPPFTPTSTHSPILAAILPANSTIVIIPTPAYSKSIMPKWLQAIIAIFSSLATIYSSVVSFLRLKMKWNRRRALTLGLRGGPKPKGSLRVQASSIPERTKFESTSTL